MLGVGRVPSLPRAVPWNEMFVLDVTDVSRRAGPNPNCSGLGVARELRCRLRSYHATKLRLAAWEDACNFV